MSSSTMLSDLAVELGAGLGSGFAVLQADAYVALVHPEYGLAAVVPTDSEELATKAGQSLSAIAERAGFTWPAMHFAISVSEVRPPWLVRSGASMCVDIATAMARGSASRPSFSEDARVAVVAALTQLPKTKTETVEASLSPHVLRLVEACVEKALAGQSAWVAGVEIEARDVVGPNFMLPAILIHAAEEWAIPVVAKKGEGGFTIRLTSDPRAILGYRVVGLDISSPVLFFLPIVNLVRRSFSGGECVLDESVRRFADFLSLHGLDTDVMGDVDIRVASTA